MKTQLLRLTSAARALLLLAALLLTLPALRAANALPPEKMSYQGFLVDANGVPLGSNAPVNHVIEFRIYNVSSGGSAIWGEAQTVTIDKGYFSVMLGDGSVLDGVPNGALSTVFSGADASDRFISVKGTSGSLAGSAEILPRLRLVTSPYAYMATTLPPGAITNGLFAAASITGDKLATNTLTAANFSTNVGLWTANGTNIFRTNGFVGIGTATPGAPLDVLGQVQVLANGTISSIGPKNSYRGLIETSYGAGNDRYGLAQGPGGNLALYTAQINGRIQFGKATGADSFSPQMTILNNGNVGIGTTGPATRLDAVGPAAAPAINLNNGVFRVGDSGATFVGMQFGQYPSGSFGSWIQSQRPADTSLWPLALNPLGGNVGIGTASPGDPLDVNGIVRARGFRGKTGLSGAYDDNVFNFLWTGANMATYVDDTFVGNLSFLSDRRLKEEIEPMQESALERLMALRPVSFKYKTIPNTIFSGSDDVQEGFVADELQRVVPSGVSGQSDAVTKDGKIQPQTINPLPVVSVLTKAAQELARQVKAQETELTELRAELAKLRTEKKSLAAAVTELQAQDEARESRLARLEQALAKDAKVIQAKATPRLAK